MDEYAFAGTQAWWALYPGLLDPEEQAIDLEHLRLKAMLHVEDLCSECVRPRRLRA